MCLVDGEYIDADAFGEDVDGVSGAAVQLVVVATVFETQGIEVGSLVFMHGMQFNGWGCDLVHGFLLKRKRGFGLPAIAPVCALYVVVGYGSTAIADVR